jgi:hypothetical protein
MNILTDKANRRFEPQLLNGDFVSNPQQFINALRPEAVHRWSDAAGTLTPTLDIPITQQSFYQTFPTYGNYTGGGLNVGLAFLSDIQVFLMLEALQGDSRAMSCKHRRSPVPTGSVGVDLDQRLYPQRRGRCVGGWSAGWTVCLPTAGRPDSDRW